MRDALVAMLFFTLGMLVGAAFANATRPALPDCPRGMQRMELRSTTGEYGTITICGPVGLN